MLVRQCVKRKRWDLDFEAQPEEVGALRRIVGNHLRRWGLAHLTDSVQLIVSELATNVIEHVGVGTQGRLTVMMRDGALRIEIRDPDVVGDPSSRKATEDAEGGRGLAIVGVLADRWGVERDESGKATWVELDSGLTGPDGHAGGHRVDKAEAVLLLYGSRAAQADGESSVGMLAMRETAVGLLGDLMAWLSAHGWDTDEALDRAQTCFESGSGAA